jgi:hypothetical protein
MLFASLLALDLWLDYIGMIGTNYEYDTIHLIIIHYTTTPKRDSAHTYMDTYTSRRASRLLQPAIDSRLLAINTAPRRPP